MKSESKIISSPLKMSLLATIETLSKGYMEAILIAFAVTGWPVVPQIHPLVVLTMDALQVKRVRKTLPSSKKMQDPPSPWETFKSNSAFVSTSPYYNSSRKGNF